MPHVLADTRSGKGSCLKAGRDGAVRQFCLKAIDIDLAQQIKESQNSEAKATSCRFWSTRDVGGIRGDASHCRPHMGQGPCLLRRNRDGTAQRRENIQPAMPRIHSSIFKHY